MTTHMLMNPRTAFRTWLLAVSVALATGMVLTSHAQAQGQRRGDAQPGPSRQRTDAAQRLERQVVSLTQRLQLTSSQATAVRQILKQEHEEIQALMQRTKGKDSANRDSLRTETRTIRTRAGQRIEGVLNEQQRSAYRTLREERWKQRERPAQQRQRDNGRRVGLA